MSRERHFWAENAIKRIMGINPLSFDFLGDERRPPYRISFGGYDNGSGEIVHFSVIGIMTKVSDVARLMVECEGNEQEILSKLNHGSDDPYFDFRSDDLDVVREFLKEGGKLEQRFKIGSGEEIL